MFRSKMILAFCCVMILALSVSANELEQVAPKDFPELYRFKDTCNVYVLKSKDRALLFDLARGMFFRSFPTLQCTTSTGFYSLTTTANNVKAFTELIAL